MERRTMLQAGWFAAVGSLAAACTEQKAPVQGTNPPAAASAKATGTPPTGNTPHAAADYHGSLPERFDLGSGKGLQLFFHGMCAFVLPKAARQPLRVAMLNAYPNDIAHRHFASFVVPRGGVD